MTPDQNNQQSAESRESTDRREKTDAALSAERETTQDKKSDEAAQQAQRKYDGAKAEAYKPRDGETEEARMARLRAWEAANPAPDTPPQANLAEQQAAQQRGQEKQATAQAAKEATSSLEARGGPGMSLQQQREGENDDAFRQRVLAGATFSNADDRKKVEGASGEDLDKLAARSGLTRYQPQPRTLGGQLTGGAPIAAPAVLEDDDAYRRRLRSAFTTHALKDLHAAEASRLDELGAELGIERLPANHQARSPLAVLQGAAGGYGGAEHHKRFDPEQAHHDICDRLDRIEMRLKSFA